MSLSGHINPAAIYIVLLWSKTAIHGAYSDTTQTCLPAGLITAELMVRISGLTASAQQAKLLCGSALMQTSMFSMGGPNLA